MYVAKPTPEPWIFGLVPIPTGWFRVRGKPNEPKKVEETNENH